MNWYKKAGQQHADFIKTQLPPLVRRVKSVILAGINRAKTQPYKNPDIALNTLGVHANGIYNAITSRYSGQSQNPNLISKIDTEIKSIAAAAVPTGLQLSPEKDGWLHYIVNGDCQKASTRDKVYISVDPTTFTARAFLSALQALGSSGFKGQIKIISNGHNMTQRFDNIVIHACDPQGASLAEASVKSGLQSAGTRLGGEGSTTRSVDAYGMSGNDFVATQAAKALKPLLSNPGITSWDQLERNVSAYFDETNGTFLQYLANAFLRA